MITDTDWAGFKDGVSVRPAARGMSGFVGLGDPIRLGLGEEETRALNSWV